MNVHSKGRSARRWPDSILPGPPLRKSSSRQQWQKECGGRLRALFDRLSADGFFPGPGNPGRRGSPTVRIAHRLHVSRDCSDCIDGAGELTRELAERIESRFGASADWLTTGDGKMFPLVIPGRILVSAGRSFSSRMMMKGMSLSSSASPVGAMMAP